MKLSWTEQERRDLLAKSFDAKALGGVSHYELANGPRRGQRIIRLQSAQGLEAEICVDRGFDIAALRYRGINLGWQGPSSFPAPVELEADNGLGLLRSFEGFLVTCGLDHFGLPAQGPADHLIYPNRDQVVYPLHGRSSGIPAIVESAGTVLETDQPYSWCTGLVRQAVVFGEVLELRRTIRMPLLGSELSIEDTVTNRGARPVRHGMLYHCNIGYPLLDAGTCVKGIGSALEKLLSDEPAIPGDGVIERFDMAEPSAGVPVTITNPTLEGVTLSIEYSADTLPNLGVWQAFQSGIFAMGIEPHTDLGDPEQKVVAGDPGVIAAYEARNYELKFSLSS